MAHSRPTKPISDLSVQEINLHLLKMRFNDSKSLLDQKETKDPSLTSLCKTMTISYGFTHSAHEEPRGLFGDVYHREAIDPKEEDLFSLMLHETRKQLKEQKILPEGETADDFFPINDHDTLKNY